MNQILYERNPAFGKLEVMGVFDWPIWEKEASTFPWTYESEETCYILEGEVIVTPDDGEPMTFTRGDLITFPKGMSCTWDIRSPIKKHYDIG